MFLLVLIVVGFIIYIALRRKSLVKQVNFLNKLLYLEKSPEKYIAEIDKILLKIQIEKERSINLIQKTTGLLFAGRFEEAIDILRDDIKKIPPYWQHVYYHNLILSMYFNDDIEGGNKALEEASEVLKEYSKKEENKTAIEFIYAVSDFYNRKAVEHKEFFEELAENGRNEYRKALGYYFLTLIYEMEDNQEKSNDNKQKALELGRGSFIELFLHQ